MKVRAIGREVRDRKLTYLSPKKLRSLLNAVDAVTLAEVPGDFLEFGVALGGSGICLASRLEPGRRYLGFDVFGMIPPPTEADGEAVGRRYRTIAEGRSEGIGGGQYYGYVDDLHATVSDSFAALGLPVDGERILLVKGLFEQTVVQHGDATVALAHIDCDWYESVRCCLDFVWPRLSPGGQVVLDDYDHWDGARKATDEFLGAHDDARILRRRPQVILVKPFS